MARIQPLTEIDQWQSIWNAAKEPGSPAVLIFKRSPICPTSHFVEGNFNHFVSRLPENPSLQIYSVDVIGARPISQRIAADTKIEHQSPQALLIKPGREIAWDASHGEINEETLAQNLPKS